MATREELDQLRQVMENMNAQIQQLQSDLVDANSRAQAADARADDANDRVMQALEAVAYTGGGKSGKGKGSGPIPTLVDTRGIGRPDSFGKGNQTQVELMFPGWRRKTTNFLQCMIKMVGMAPT